MKCLVFSKHPNFIHHIFVIILSYLFCRNKKFTRDCSCFLGKPKLQKKTCFQAFAEPPKSAKSPLARLWRNSTVDTKAELRVLHESRAWFVMDSAQGSWVWNGIEPCQRGGSYGERGAWAPWVSSGWRRTLARIPGRRPARSTVWFADYAIAAWSIKNS